jgi:hypothetical protein
MEVIDMSDDTQEKRREHLTELVEIYHRGRYGDYNETYDEFSRTYLGIDPHGDGEDDAELTTQAIPRFASIAIDETYGMIHLFDKLTDALNDQAGIPDSGEYLNVPVSVIDLDTGTSVKSRRIELTEELHAYIIALLRAEINGDGEEIADTGIRHIDGDVDKAEQLLELIGGSA